MNDYIPSYWNSQGTDDMELLADDRELADDSDLNW